MITTGQTITCVFPTATLTSGKTYKVARVLGQGEILVLNDNDRLINVATFRFKEGAKIEEQTKKIIGQALCIDNGSFSGIKKGSIYLIVDKQGSYIFIVNELNLIRRYDKKYFTITNTANINPSEEEKPVVKDVKKPYAICTFPIEGITFRKEYPILKFEDVLKDTYIWIKNDAGNEGRYRSKRFDIVK
jgi:hypothetical protein